MVAVSSSSSSSSSSFEERPATKIYFEIQIGIYRKGDHCRKFGIS